MEKKELKIPNLDAIDKTMPFDVPEGYFDDVVKQIVAQTTAPKAQPIKRTLINRLTVAIAACALIAVLIGTLLFAWGQRQKTEILLQEDYYNQIINEGVSEDMLVEHILCKQIKKDENKIFYIGYYVHRCTDAYGTISLFSLRLFPRKGGRNEGRQSGFCYGACRFYNQRSGAVLDSVQ